MQQPCASSRVVGPSWHHAEIPCGVAPPHEEDSTVRMRRSALVVRGRLAQHLNGCDVHTVSMWRSVAASEATNHTLRFHTQ